MAREVVANASVCAICDKPPTATDPLTMGHKLVAFSKGGPAEPWNVQAEHRTCNSRKGAR